jgi:4-aminobutyrate aminotransferase-like enzyme
MLRLLPPLCLSKDDADLFMEKFEKVLTAAKA